MKYGNDMYKLWGIGPTKKVHEKLKRQIVLKEQKYVSENKL